MWINLLLSFLMCPLLFYLNRFLRATHSRNRNDHSQSGLSSFLLMFVCSPHRKPSLPASSRVCFLWVSLIYQKPANASLLMEISWITTPFASFSSGVMAVSSRMFSSFVTYRFFPLPKIPFFSSMILIFTLALIRS